ncbi:MAG: sodium:proton antiporter NhaD [Planctomycetota bacterium]
MALLMISIFALGYLAIALEHPIRVNKAASALLTGVLCWVVYVLGIDTLLPGGKIPQWFIEEFARESGSDGSIVSHAMRLAFLVDHQLLGRHVGEISGILFFLMGAMTIVELIDANEGFAIVTNRIRPKSKVSLLWIVAWMAFFFSSVLDNLTTTIVMVSLLGKLIKDRNTRLVFAGVVVIAANAGGAWTVIGDVTTTMLWIKHKITPVAVMNQLFLGSVACLLLPLSVLSFAMRGELERPEAKADPHEAQIPRSHQLIFLILGVLGLLSVPVFKTFTHLPPFMGMMLALSLMWIASERLHADADHMTKSSTGLVAVLRRIDMSSVLFFLGILLAVGCLGATGMLHSLATALDGWIGNRDVVAILIGLISAVVDNVPLVAAGIEMYTFPPDDHFWMLLAYCAGTGGSCLIIGSAAGVAAMGIERIDFLWYARKIGPWALLGYLAGAGVYLAQQNWF